MKTPELDELIVTLKKCKFSLIIDETTDISTVKQLVLICRYYNLTLRKTVDKYLALISVTDCSASEIVKLLLNFFEKHAIPFDSLIGFASYNASVMMGRKNGVQHLLQQKVPALYVQGCVCHSMHLCASKPCLKLPNELEDLARVSIPTCQIAQNVLLNTKSFRNLLIPLLEKFCMLAAQDDYV